MKVDLFTYQMEARTLIRFKKNSLVHPKSYLRVPKYYLEYTFGLIIK